MVVCADAFPASSSTASDTIAPPLTIIAFPAMSFAPCRIVREVCLRRKRPPGPTLLQTGNRLARSVPLDGPHSWFRFARVHGDDLGSEAGCRRDAREFATQSRGCRDDR